MPLNISCKSLKSGSPEVSEPFRVFLSLQKINRSHYLLNHANGIGVACGACLVLETKISKPDLCESSNCRYESQVISNTLPFLNKRLLVQADLRSLSRNSYCLFWYHFGAYRQHKTHTDSIWSWTCIFCSGHHVPALWSCHPSTESICDMVMYPSKITIHYQSRGDANHLVWQHARRAAWPAHTPFVSRAIGLSTHIAPNINGTIWSKWSHVNVTKLLPDQHERSQLSIESIRKDIYLV
jgi:hypothetical protein